MPAVDGNVSELRDVLMNLIFNAVDAMPQGGTLQHRDRERERPRNTVLVTVEDTGVGMTAGGAPAVPRALLHDQGRARERAWDWR